MSSASTPATKAAKPKSPPALSSGGPPSVPAVSQERSPSGRAMNPSTLMPRKTAPVKGTSMGRSVPGGTDTTAPFVADGFRRQSPGGSWAAVEDRGSPTADHMDHVHVNDRG